VPERYRKGGTSTFAALLTSPPRVRPPQGKLKEQVNNAVLFDKATYEKLTNEAVKSKLITVSTLSDRLRITGSLARAALKELAGKGVIKAVNLHSSQVIYTRAVGGGSD